MKSYIFLCVSCFRSIWTQSKSCWYIVTVDKTHIREGLISMIWSNISLKHSHILLLQVRPGPHASSTPVTLNINSRLTSSLLRFALFSISCAVFRVHVKDPMTQRSWPHTVPCEMTLPWKWLCGKLSYHEIEDTKTTRKWRRSEEHTSELQSR